ncbi:hypothetical protein TNIN_48501 [Trichonephila inaurata madagascariensis]|uniref:Endonuclease/exonuclease/phosphatase domain-containing protein n=1 Tax=Trichonephila inaurata madagascariensis TaxID=2747483 RepID=A0A8X7BPD7_9ARAC|nr:hypothetical protein TNIN_48501 [Trichonephila inaurata madagascariensis]
MITSDNHVLKCVQLNLHKSKSATQQLILNMEADNIDCTLVQEPHSYRSSLPGYPSTYRLFYNPNSDIINAAIIVRFCHLSTFIDYKNTDYNMVTLEVITGSTACTLFSY